MAGPTALQAPGAPVSGLLPAGQRGEGRAESGLGSGQMLCGASLARSGELRLAGQERIDRIVKGRPENACARGWGNADRGGIGVALCNAVPTPFGPSLEDPRLQSRLPTTNSGSRGRRSLGRKATTTIPATLGVATRTQDSRPCRHLASRGQPSSQDSRPPRVAGAPALATPGKAGVHQLGRRLKAPS